MDDPDVIYYGHLLTIQVANLNPRVQLHLTQDLGWRVAPGSR
jgi:hypothetical protein